MTGPPSFTTSRPAVAGPLGDRAIAARGPATELATLRAAYLDLLKLSLCDLIGTSTTSVEGLPHGKLASRELADEELRLRAVGADWPRHALTMTGLRRLDDLQACVETIVADGIAGDLIEAGTWRGGSSMLMRATLDCLGEEQRTVWVADSFQGFPASEAAAGAGSRGYAASLAPYFAAFDFLAVGLDEVRASFRRLGLEQGIEFVPGFFETTLPQLPERRWSLARLDSDAYDTTLLALRHLYPNLSVGGYLVIDDYGALDECRAAVEDFRREHEITEPLERVDWTCARWRRQNDAPIRLPRGLPPDPAVGAPAPVSRPRERSHIPSVEEVELTQEITQLRRQLAQTEAELGRARTELGGQLREMSQSASWRLTEPLRRLSHWRRRLPR